MEDYWEGLTDAQKETVRFMAQMTGGVDPLSQTPEERSQPLPPKLARLQEITRKIRLGELTREEGVEIVRREIHSTGEDE